MKDWPATLLEDKEFMLQAISKCDLQALPWDVIFAGRQKDKEFVLQAVRASRGYALTKTIDLKDDKKFVKQAIKAHPRAYLYASDRLREDEEVAWEAVFQDVTGEQHIFWNLDEDLQKDEGIDRLFYEIVVFQSKCCLVRSTTTKRVSPGLSPQIRLECRDITAKKVLEFIIPEEAFVKPENARETPNTPAPGEDSTRLLLDASVLRKEVQRITGKEFTRYRFVFDDDTALDADVPEQKIVLDADNPKHQTGTVVARDERNIRRGRAVARDERDKKSERTPIREMALKKRGYELKMAPKPCRKDKEKVLDAVRLHGSALEYASPELKGDREVVMAAVRRAPDVLKHASAALRGDPKVVSEAVVHDKVKNTGGGPL